MDGVLSVNKPSGPTSHDVVARIRRATQEKRVGHAGTLDPAASGVLAVCLGNATRIVEYLMDWPKAYRTSAVLGAETDTEDQTGCILRETDCSQVTCETVEAVLARFVGKMLQMPPMVSAVHHKGRRLYELARAGRDVERAPRPVEVYSLRLVDFSPGAKAVVVLDVECSRGTYVRTLCADIGRALDCGAYMSSLVRTAVGPFRLEDAVSIETVEEKTAAGRLADIIHTIDEALGDMPSVSVSEDDVARITNGVAIPVESLPRCNGELPPIGTTVRIHAPDARLLAVGRLRRVANGEAVLRAEKVFAGSR